MSNREMIAEIDYMSKSKGYEVEIEMSNVGVLSMVLARVLEKLLANDFTDTNTIKFIKIEK